MGLLNKILNENNAENETNGLLKKAEHILSDEEKMFRILLSKLNVSKAAIFSLDNNIYSINYSTGLQEETISKSVSTKDFWDGLNLAEDSFFQTDEELNPFYQLFSEKDKDNLSGLYISKLQSSDILMIPVYNDNTINNISEIKQSIISFLYDENETKINNALLHNNKALLLILSKPQGFCQDEIEIIKQTVSDFDIFKQNDDIIKLVLFSQTEIDLELYKIQLTKTLKSLDDNFKCENLNIESAGYCSSLKGIKTFISQVL